MKKNENIMGNLSIETTITAVSGNKGRIKPSALAAVDKTAFLQALDLRLTEIGVGLTFEQKQKLADYYELLVGTNRVMNLTGIVEAAEVAEKHIADSLRLLKYLKTEKETPVKTIIDVGTGAGLPGIPLAVAHPDFRVILLDSQKKRCGFLEKACAELKLSNTQVVWGRAEELGHKAEYREKADFAVARAVAPLPVLLEYLTAFVNPGGKILAMKGSNIAREQELARGALRELNASVAEVAEYELTSGEKRSLVVIKKTNLLKQKYPRNSGLIKKKPL
ncbi:MAG: 16S rRNA (guanine(527)-N(7))-methyltransferase RsmG [Bacillota bacterium]|jgi:16S rRNA (guanine527-N7)-methyltransferase